MEPASPNPDILHAVLDAVRTGRFADAARLAGDALAAGEEHPILLNASALGLEQQGRLADAEKLLRRAVEIAPTDVGARTALGLNLMQREAPAAALEHFNAVLTLDDRLPFAHVNRANALRSLGAVSNAESGYIKALELDPNQAMALAGLAQIASHRGSYHDARMFAQRSLELAPDYPDAVLSLAAAELGDHQPLRALERVRRLIGDGRLSALERAHANGLLGDILDAQDHTDEAVAAYTACNEALKRWYGPRFAGESALDYALAMGRYFERTEPDAWRHPPAAAPRYTPRGHVFLLGFPRSGTTLLEVILEGSPDVVSLEEKESLLDAVREYMRSPADLDRLAAAPAARLEALRGAYWRAVAREGVDVAGKVFVDKHPLNTLKLPLIARLFPDAKVIIACRDPRDVVLSCFRHRFQMSAPIYELLTLDGAARYYDAVMRLLVAMMSRLALDTCLVRHEDLVTEFAREMKRICVFTGIEWSPGMGDFAQRTRQRSVLTPSTAQLVRGLSTEGLGHWRRYRSHLEPVFERLAPWIERFYYGP